MNPDRQNGSDEGSAADASSAARVRAVLLEHLPGYEPVTITVTGVEPRTGSGGELVEVDGTLGISLPTSAGPVGSHRLRPSVEATLLRSLAGLLDVPLPVPVLQDDEQSVRGFRTVPGRRLGDLPDLEPPAALRLARRLGAALADLHGVDASDTGADLPIVGGPESYRAAAARVWAAVGGAVTDAGLHAAVTQFLQEPAPDHPPHPSLCHLDLCPASILLDEDSLLCGIQHWANAGVGDPARDLGSVLLYLGSAGLDAALDGYRRAGAVTDDDPELAQRIVFHARCAAIEDAVRHPERLASGGW